jgi:hypothetical protein
MTYRTSAVALVLASAALLGSAPLAAQTKLWTTTADFNTGALTNTADTAPPNEVILGPTPVSLNHVVWSTNYYYGYVVRIDTVTGKQTGRYDSVLSAINGVTTGARPPQELCNWSNTGNCPGRVAVDTNADVWIINRAFGNQGTLTKFAGNITHCIDRNNNGVIDTSADLNGDGIIDITPSKGEYLGQNDECILNTIPIGPNDEWPRGVAVDKYGKIWACTFEDGMLYRYNPNEPIALEATINLNALGQTHPYSLSTGGDYIFVSNNGGAGGTRRVNITTLAVDAAPCANTPGATTYGIAADPGGQVAWLGDDGIGGLWTANFGVTPHTCTWTAAPGGESTAVTLDTEPAPGPYVWLANYGNATSCKYTTAGALIACYAAGGTLPHGIAVDFQGNIWSVLDGPSLMSKINSTNGAMIGTYTINALVAGDAAYVAATTQTIPNPAPYLYSDFTGVQINRQAPYTYVGSWDAVFNGQVPAIPWSTVTWNTEPQGAVPALTSLVVSARAADTLSNLGVAAFTPVTSGATLAGIQGQYIEVHAALEGPGFVTSVLSDLTVVGPCPAPGLNCCVQNSDCNNGNVCSTGTCPMPGGTCQFTPIPNCCQVASDCNDGTACTVDSCPTPGGQCVYTPVPGCCNTNADCADNNPCTVDLCSGPGGTCSYPIINGCCLSNNDCTKGNACSAAVCPKPGGFCTGGPIPGCCSQNSDCATNDLCTPGNCDLATNTCENMPILGCCDVDGQCNDGNPCTVDHCSGPGGMCVHTSIPNCCTPGDPQVGQPCDVPQAPYDKPPCKAGKLVCNNGTFTCVGAVLPSYDVCNGQDDNCDGIVDAPNPGGPPLCPPSLTCVDGDCVAACGSGEFPCAPGFVCVNGFCMPTDCSKLVCPTGQVCDMGVCLVSDGGPTSSSSSSTSGTGSSTASSSSASTGTGTGTGVGGASGATGPATTGVSGTSGTGGSWGLATGGGCHCSIPGAPTSDDAPAPRGPLALLGLGLLAALRTTSRPRDRRRLDRADREVRSRAAR